MRRAFYTTEQLQFLRDHYPKMWLVDLTDAFNAKFGTQKTERQIKSTLKNHKIRCGRPPGGGVRHNHLLTQEQDAFVRQHYAALGRKGLTAALNERFGLELKVSQLVSYVKNHKISSGRTGHFKKGQSPFNAGTKGFMKPNKTSFQKGNRPHTAVPVGTISATTGDGYLKRKVAEPNEWVFVHLETWEKHNGPVPDGFAVTFIDGDRTNCSIENLELISRAELAVRNKKGYSNLPQELKPIAATSVRLRLAVGEARRRHSKSVKGAA